MIGRCVICGDPTPEHSNPSRVRKLCDKRACRAARSRESARLALAAYRAKHNVDGRTDYTCSVCGETKPLTIEHWSPDKRDPATGEVIRWARWCKPCKRERSRVAALTKRQHEQRKRRNRETYRARLERMRREDPVGYAALRRQWADAERKYRREHPELAQAAQRRYRARLKQDPVRYGRHLEHQRIAYRLRAEREGRSLDDILSGRGVRLRRRQPSLPAAPLGQLLERIIIREQSRRMDGVETEGQVLEDRETICLSLGTTSRTLWDWSHGRRHWVQYATADRILTALGLHWWDVWDRDELGRDHPELLARLEA